MELPNYSRQLMQQLHTLRKEGHFCDCTILVGDTPHRAHKLVLAASSLLFRSLLEDSDSVSIDPAVVTSQEFSSLLEMAYTGRLPPGKHNFTHVISAADSLQMFDVAVSCKNILASLMRRPATLRPQSPDKVPPGPAGNQEVTPVVLDPSLGAPEKTVLEVAEPVEQGAVNVSQEGNQTPGSNLQGSNNIESIQEPTVKKECHRGPENLELLILKQDEIAEIIGDAELWVKTIEMWESISREERQVILGCCRGSGGPRIFHRLLNSVREDKGLSAHTLLTLLDLLREHQPELGPVLKEQGEHMALPQEQPSVEHQGSSAEETAPLGSFLLEHTEEVADALAGMSDLANRLMAAVKQCAEERTKEVVLECCRSKTPQAVANHLMDSVRDPEGGVAEDDLMTLLQELQYSCPALKRLLSGTQAHISLAGDPTGCQEEADGCELLRKYHSRLLESVTDPQLLLCSLDAMTDYPTKERECAQALLQQDSGAPCLDGLLSEALQGETLSALSVWRLLFRAAAQDSSLKELIQEVRGQPGAQKLIHSAMDTESLHMDLLLKHKALILRAIGELATLETGLQATEQLPEDVTEFLSACHSQDSSVSVGDILARVLDQQELSAQPFCRLLSLNQHALPSLLPLFSDLEQAGKELELKGDAEGSQQAKSPDSEEQREMKGSAKQGNKQCYCQWCGKAFAFRCRMEVHRKRCRLSEEGGQRCPHCSLELATPRALQQHLAQMHEDPPRKKRRKQEMVACDLCGKTFAHPSGMLYHKRTDHFDEKPYACKECGAKFAANSSLKNHQRLHTGERPFHCKHCDMSFSQAAALSYHAKKKHSEGKMYACQYCEALFAQSIELTRHVRTHTGDRPYVCRECGKGFSQANGLSVHLHTFHNIADPHDCQKCRMSFASLEEHRKHIQESHPKEYHQCDMCNKIFNSAALLDKHMLSHVGGKPYNCKICHKAYQQLSGLWYHNRTTHPEIFAGQGSRALRSLLQCPICSKAFSSNASLLKHQKAEHPEGALECKDCKDTFADPDSLEAHKKEKHPESHQCPYCPSTFTSAVHMQKHICAQHVSQQGELFCCARCDLLFPSQSELQDHFISRHLETLSTDAQLSNSQMVIHAEASSGPEQVIALDQSQLGGSQVYVALTDSATGAAASEIVAVDMEDLLDGTVTFICGESQ